MSSKRLARRVPAQSRMVGALRHEVIAYAEQLGAAPAARDAIALAVSEAMSNVVLHAYIGCPPGDIVLQAWPSGDGHMFVRVCDEGRGMIPRTDSPGLGVGMSLMATMADDLHVTDRHGTGTIVELRFALHRGE